MAQFGLVRQSSPVTWGAISRGHQRNALFAPSMSGPAVLPNGKLNRDLTLVFCRSDGLSVPRTLFRWRNLTVLFGADAAVWCRLSDKDMSAAFVGKIAVTWRHGARGPRPAPAEQPDMPGGDDAA